MKIIKSITTVSISVNEMTHKFREQIQKCTREISFILQNCQRRYKSSQKQKECTHNWSKFIRWLITSLYTEVKIIESIMTVSISVDKITHKFREWIQKCTRKKFLFFYLNTNYSLFNFIVHIITCFRHYAET